VHAVAVDGRSLDAALAAAEAGLDDDQKPLLRMLAYGALRRHYRLSGWIDALLDKPLKRRDAVIESLLAVGLLQLTGTRIPDHAVVSETVEAARRLGRPRLAGLVNAVLRRFVRDALAAAPPAGEEARYDHPAWLIEIVRRDWPGDWPDILDAGNQRAPMWLRVNTVRIGRDRYRDRLSAAGIDSDVIPGLDQAIRLAEPLPVRELPGFAAGDVSVQDGGAQLAAPWLLAGAEGRIVDACAAPGGKSAHIKELGGDSVDLTSIDIDEQRAASIRDNLARLGLATTVVVADASRALKGEQLADGILLDAPCSATGVIRRHPDIKLLRKARDIGRMADRQARLLGGLWAQLRPGGRLLYVTCSILTDENDAVVGRFLETHGDAIENDVLHNNNIRDLMRRKACGYQLLPGTAGMDGFYYACLEKRA